MKKLSAAAIALLASVAVATPASAQMGGGLGDKETPMQKIEKRKEEERKQIEKDYDKTMSRLKGQSSTQPSSSDPWAAVRPAGAEAKTETKTEPIKR
jgi:Spy/CpxP family protein refolding chaperone